MAPPGHGGVIDYDFIGPGKRQIDWWTDQERDTLFWTRPPNQFTKFAGLLRKMFAHVEHYQIVQIGMPEKPCRTQVLRDMHLDAVTAKNGSSHVPRGLVTVDQENLLVSKIRAAARCIGNSKSRVVCD